MRLQFKQTIKRAGEGTVAMMIVLAIIGALFGHDRAVRGPLIQRVQQNRAVRVQQRQMSRQPVIVVPAPTKTAPPKVIEYKKK